MKPSRHRPDRVRKRETWEQGPREHRGGGQKAGVERIGQLPNLHCYLPGRNPPKQRNENQLNLRGEVPKWLLHIFPELKARQAPPESELTKQKEQ
jgi:hypothetical protein